MNIATIGINYPQTRLVLNGKVEGVNYYSYQNWINPILKQILHTYEIYIPFFKRHIDAYHVINTIMITDKPWCCSFETMIPRGRQLITLNHHNSFDLKKGWYMEKLLNVLDKDNCKKLIAFSDCNLMMQKMVFDEFGVIGKRLNLKLTKINVPQPLLIDSPKNKVNNGKLHFFFVGNDFVRKGVPEAILAMKELRQIRDDFEITIVTKVFNTVNYAFNDFQDTTDYLDGILKIVYESKDWIHLYSHLPFNKVLDLMKKCDVGLLPTWAESYGYSVLEMQACGLPVVTTNIRALREINKNGWIINLPINWAGELGLNNCKQKNEVRNLLIEELKNAFIHILDNREEVLEKGKKSFSFIRDSHSPMDYNRDISRVYELFKK